MKFEIITQKEYIPYLILAIAAIAVHLINLGLTPLMADEAIRATVAFEMIQREDYIVPTIWGEYYYRKPPLYNWIIIGFFKLFNSYSEFVFRLPSVLSHFLLGLAIWRVASKRINEHAALLAAFAFILSGRLLTRDSLLGHIDLTFSLFTFIGFYAVFFFHERKQYTLLFTISYFLAACATLMKGLPSILFQGATLLVWFAYKRNFLKLLSLQHLAGIIVYVAIVGGYFYAYSHFNSLDTYFSELYGQAAMRTVVEKEWYEGVLNLFTFPIENFGHLFPTSLFLLYLFRKGIIKRWLKDDFLAFTFLVLAINVIPYWLSPGYYPRYLFMLYPLVFILGAEAYVRFKDEQPIIHIWVMRFFLILGGIITLGSFAAVFVEELRALPLTYPAIVCMLLAGGYLLWLWRQRPSQRIIWALCFITLFRFGFDAFVLPYRYYVEDSLPNYIKEQSAIIVEKSADKPLHLFRTTPAYMEYAYYLGVAKDQVIEKHDTARAGSYYLVDNSRLKYLDDYEVIYSFPMRYESYIVNVVEIK